MSNVLKFNPTSTKFEVGKVNIEDCSFTIPSLALPITIATAFVDATYPNIAPYFSDYTIGAQWVEAQIAAGAGTGNVIITSNQAECDLINNVNIWLAPSVTIDSFTGSSIHDVYIDGDGTINILSLTNCQMVNCRARVIANVNLQASVGIKLFLNEATKIDVYSGMGIDLNVYGSAGALAIDGEALVHLAGMNAVFGSIRLLNNSSLRANNIRVLGTVSNGAACKADFQDSEFYSASGIPIESVGDISLTNCWDT